MPGNSKQPYQGILSATRKIVASSWLSLRCKKVRRASLVQTAHADFAGDGLHITRGAAAAHAGAEHAFALFFDHDRNVGSNLARNGLRGKMEIGRGRNFQ